MLEVRGPSSHGGFTREHPRYVQFGVRDLQPVVSGRPDQIVLVLGKPGIRDKGVWLKSLPTSFQESESRAKMPTGFPN